ncbi:MAG: 50S ribosomal protein L10 [Patescibacteria group bacterium]|nr:50S ribosomal protein L10 [Patescibacteria group bacterium]MDD5715237.1 50S ribosomal protein L10 [Patescibacteria group bacterium]
MPKTKAQKKEALSMLTDRLKRTNAVVFTNFDGLTVKEVNEMRSHLREAGIDYTVAKKTLLKLAFKNAPVEGMDVDKLTGSLGMAAGYDDEVLPAKTLSIFAKKHPALKLIGGIIGGRFAAAAEVAQLASLPSKQELTAKVVWLIQYPIGGFVQVLSGTLRSLVYALKAIEEKKA